MKRNLLTEFKIEIYSRSHGRQREHLKQTQKIDNLFRECFIAELYMAKCTVGQLVGHIEIVNSATRNKEHGQRSSCRLSFPCSFSLWVGFGSFSLWVCENVLRQSKLHRECSAENFCNSYFIKLCRKHLCVNWPLRWHYHFLEFHLLVIVSFQWSCKRYRNPVSCQYTGIYTGVVRLEKTAVTPLLSELFQRKSMGHFSVKTGFVYLS